MKKIVSAAALLAVFLTLSLAAAAAEELIITATVPCEEDSHRWAEEYTVDREPTCTEDGWKSIHCLDCGETKDGAAIPRLGHAWDNGRIVRKATGKEPGERVFTCSRCGETRSETIPAKDQPATGDNNHLGVWIALAAVCAAALAALLIGTIRKKNKEGK